MQFFLEIHQESQNSLDFIILNNKISHSRYKISITESGRGKANPRAPQKDHADHEKLDQRLYI